jgi:hypothetical protein
MFEDLLKEIEATKEKRRPTPTQAKEIEAKSGERTDLEFSTGGPSRKQAATPTPRGAAAVSTPIKYTRRRALASAPPPHPEPLIDGQQGPPAFLYSVLRNGRVGAGHLYQPGHPERARGPLMP